MKYHNGLAFKTNTVWWEWMRFLYPSQQQSNTERTSMSVVWLGHLTLTKLTAFRYNLPPRKRVGGIPPMCILRMAKFIYHSCLACLVKPEVHHQPACQLTAPCPHLCLLKNSLNCIFPDETIFSKTNLSSELLQRLVTMKVQESCFTWHQTFPMLWNCPRPYFDLFFATRFFSHYQTQRKTVTATKDWLVSCHI